MRHVYIRYGRSRSDDLASGQLVANDNGGAKTLKAAADGTALQHLADMIPIGFVITRGGTACSKNFSGEHYLYPFCGGTSVAAAILIQEPTVH